MKYDRDYFHKELLLLQNLQYNDYKDKTDFDILIDKLNSEEVYTYYDVDWKAFAYELVNYEYNAGLKFIVEDDTLESVCSRIISREVKIKLLLFIQRNMQEILQDCFDLSGYIEKECARLISKEIEESRRDQYHGEFASMPRPDYRAMLASESLFYEKTPMKQWIESHLEEDEDDFEDISAVMDILLEFADECSDPSNYCSKDIIVDEAFTRYLRYKNSGVFNSDIWQYIHDIDDTLKNDTGVQYWRMTPAYQVMAVLYVMLKGAKKQTTMDKSIMKSIEKVVFSRDNFSCTKEMADAAVRRIKGEKVDNEVEKLPGTALTQISQLTKGLQKAPSNVTQNFYLVNGNLVNGDQVAHKDANIDKNFGPISCTE